jgi:regulator of sirC expression with transglutaminase-like and TPR domain
LRNGSPTPPIALGRIWPRRHSWSRESSTRASIRLRISIASIRWAMRRSISSRRIPGTMRRSARASMPSIVTCLAELGYAGNREQFEDPRNSCLNEVMDRKKGHPITMSIIYIEIARRAGVRAEGVNFPGHFLVRCLQDLHTDDPSEGLIVDPFHAGAILNEAECRKLLEPHIDEAAFDPSLLARATRRQILVRMLLNLKKLYVKMHSFPQARATTDALLALQPSSLADLRDRGSSRIT